MTASELTRWRLRMKWTQKKAAAWWPCDVRTWQRYEEGKAKIPKPLAMRIANPRHDVTYLVDNQTADK